MMRFSFCNTILIVSLLTPLSGYTQGPIVQCSSDMGTAVFSDSPCPYEMKTDPSVGKMVPAVAKSKAVRGIDKFFAAEEARAVAFRDRALFTHRFPRDETTLKSARTLTTSLDEMSVTKRRQMLASLPSIHE